MTMPAAVAAGPGSQTWGAGSRRPTMAAAAAAHDSAMGAEAARCWSRTSPRPGADPGCESVSAIDRVRTTVPCRDSGCGCGCGGPCSSGHGHARGGLFVIRRRQFICPINTQRLNRPLLSHLPDHDCGCGFGPRFDRPPYAGASRRQGPGWGRWNETASGQLWVMRGGPKKVK
jgi:hypothetical protein